MPYEVFKSRVNQLIERAGGNLNVSFSHHDGKHYARVSDGTLIVGNASALSVRVKWGSGHTANAII